MLFTTLTSILNSVNQLDNNELNVLFYHIKEQKYKTHPSILSKTESELLQTQSLTMNIPSDIFVAVNETKQEFRNRIKVMLATHLYQLEKLTIGKAAQLAEMQRLEFETFLSKNRIPISNLEWDDIEADIEKLI